MNGDDLLHWRLYESGSAETASQAWNPLLLAPAHNEGFLERRSYLFLKPQFGATLYVDDEPLKDSEAGADCWIWEPGFFAGEVTAELTALDGTTIALYLLDVSPDPDKLGRGVFGDMVRELWEEEPESVIGEEPAVTAIGASGRIENLWLAFARLRRYGNDALTAIETIRTCPRRTLRFRRANVPVRSVRRVDRQTVRSMRHAPNLSMDSSGPIGELASSGGGLLDVPQIEENLDSPPNRAILALQLALLRRTRTVVERLGKQVEKERHSDTRTSLSQRWPKRRAFLEQLTIRLERTRRQFPWPDVTRAEVSSAGLTAISADPIYARAWSTGWRALRMGIEDIDTSERLWVCPSWEIYERWCFVKIARMLRLRLPKFEWKRRENERIGTDGDCKLRFVLQPTFRAGPSGPGIRWSVSKERIPDLMLEIESAGQRRFLLLDAKYRSSRQSVLDAMGSAHIYQDSLRIGPQRPDGALLLVPAGGGAEWLEMPSYHLTHQVGVHVLTPGDEPNLPEFVLAFLDQWTKS